MKEVAGLIVGYFLVVCFLNAAYRFFCAVGWVLQKLGLDSADLERSA